MKGLPLGQLAGHRSFSRLCCSRALLQNPSGAGGLRGSRLLWTRCLKGRHTSSLWPYKLSGLIWMFSCISRAIYFAAYSKSKEIFNGLLVPNSGAVHMASAGVAGELGCVLALADLSRQREESRAQSPCNFCVSRSAFVTNSLMNPVWMVKTRMQLERKCVPHSLGTKFA